LSAGKIAKPAKLIGKKKKRECDHSECDELSKCVIIIHRIPTVWKSMESDLSNLQVWTSMGGKVNRMEKFLSA